MSYVAHVQELPQEWQVPLLKVLEAFESKIHADLAVRRKDFDALRAVVRDLAEAQKHTEQRVGRLEVALAELAESQKRTEQRVEELAEAQKRTERRVEELAEAQKRTEQRVEELAEAQKRTERRVEELAEAQREMMAAIKTLTDVQSTLVGDRVERRYRERAFGYFGPVLRRAQSVSLGELEPQLEQHLSDREMDDLRWLDVLVRGKARRHPDEPEVWLAVEVSATVDSNDVERARRRAELLRKAGYLAMPVAAGERVLEGAKASAAEHHVFLLQDGQHYFWEEALAAALAAFARVNRPENEL